jgi:hypothetical protein
MTDLQQTATGDVDTTGGDIQLANATLQHQADCIQTYPGSLKHAPGVGVGIEDHMNDESPEAMLRKIRQELTRDGMKIQRIRTTPSGTIEISGAYETI